jgi:hypothetical protein
MGIGWLSDFSYQTSAISYQLSDFRFSATSFGQSFQDAHIAAAELTADS